MTSRALAAVLIAATLLVGCGGGDATVTSDGPATATATAMASDGTGGDAAAPDDDTTFDASQADGTCDDAPADAPLVIAATLVRTADGWTASATVCSLYDGPDRYADAWRVTTPDGEVLGVRELAHDHAGEQPFERSLSGTFDVPDDVDVLVVEARDQRDGWVPASALEVPVDRG